MLREWFSPFGTVLRLQRRRPAADSTQTARVRYARTLHAHCMHTAGYAEETALSVACKAGFREVCTLLVGRGARLHNENEDESPAEVGRRPPTRHVRRAVTHTCRLCVRSCVTPRPWRGRCSRSRATLSFWPSSRCSRSSATARPNMSACGEPASRAVSICCLQLASRPLLFAPPRYSRNARFRLQAASPWRWMARTTTTKMTIGTRTSRTSSASSSWKPGQLKTRAAEVGGARPYRTR